MNTIISSSSTLFKKNHITFLFLSFFMITGHMLIAQITPADYTPNLDEETKEIIIKFKDSESLTTTALNGQFLDSAINDICGQYGTFSAHGLKSTQSSAASISNKVNRPRVHSYITVEYESSVDIQALIQDLSAHQDVEYAEANGFMYGSFKTIENKLNELEESIAPIVPNDPFYDATSSGPLNIQYWCENDGTLHNWDQTPDYFPTCVVDADIDMEEAWEITTGEKSVVIGHMDTGIRTISPDIQGRILDEYDFVNNDNDATDDHGHGSNTGGICFATGNNNELHAGVNWKSDVLIAKVLDGNNSGQWNDLADGIIWAVDNGANVITASIGGQSPPQLVKDAVEYAFANNVSIVASSGNEDQNTQNYPSSYPEVISVGATTCNDARVSNNTWGSNYHSTVELVAPGSFILGLRHTDDGAGQWFGGTSMSTPMVAGAISLMLSIDPTLSVNEIRNILQETADDQVGKSNEDVAGFDIYHGYGRLNVFNALSALVDCDNAVEGAPCDDNDACTINDVYNDVCLCRGTFQDSDNDGVCNVDDLCPGFNDNNDIDEDNIPDACDDDVDCSGISCDDNNNCTVNDVYDSNCNCAGISLDSVDNGSCNLSDSYCDVTGSSTTTISRVQIGNIDNSSGANSYTDYSSQYALVATQGDVVNVQLEVSVGNGGVGGTGSWVYIDFNQNGVFDSNERVVDGSGETVNTTFTVPSSAPDGATMMRVYGFFDFIFITPSGPCASSQYAEIEDYAVIIGQGPQNCSPGNACDDNDVCTSNDVFDANCNCSGTYQDSDNDGVCNAEDICPGGDDTVDSDGDGIPDACDGCSVVGNPCNDGDACTINDVFDVNCNCSGTYQDSDNDSVCNANDVCPGGDDTIDSDGDGIPDACDGCNNSGNPCNDGDACTINDVFDANCNCAGTYQDSDNDGVCDANDICSGGNDTIDSDGDGIPDFCDPNVGNECETDIIEMSNIAGDLKLNGSCYGIILESEDGTCYKITVLNSGQLSAVSVDCN